MMLDRRPCVWFVSVVVAVMAAATFAQPAPDFELPVLDQSSTLRLSDLKGKVVYVDFWASWCGPCALSLPELDSLRSRLYRQGFEVVAINLDASVDDARQFLKRNPVSYPVLLDRDQVMPAVFGVQGMPTAFLVDRSGQLRLTHAGFKKGDSKKLTKIIEQLLQEDSAL